MTSPSHDRNLKLQRNMRQMKRAIPSAKPYQDVDMAPRDTDLEILCEDFGGRYPSLVPFRLTDQGWVNSRTGTRVAPRVGVVGWRMRGW